MFPVDDLRREFPALEQAGAFLFFDNAAGAQIPAGVLAAVTDHLVSRNRAVSSIDGATVHGIADHRRLDDRVPTVSFTVRGADSSSIATELARQGIGARSGHMYSPRLMQRLNLMPGGLVRVSLVPYNTVSEVERFRECLSRILTAHTSKPA
jgi:selenocysteine lyase/cysteine desulfurase